MASTVVIAGDLVKQWAHVSRVANKEEQRDQVDRLAEALKSINSSLRESHAPGGQCQQNGQQNDQQNAS